jgi:hypothetical protein
MTQECKSNEDGECLRMSLWIKGQYFDKIFKDNT